jgi:hypothetical protein
LSVGFSMSIALHAATLAWRLLAFTAAGLPSPPARVTLWITTAIHLDTPRYKGDPFVCSAINKWGSYPER